MAIYIKNLNVGSFRGIHNLEIDELNHINIIAGDNNSGKTSILEALLFLINPKDFNNILRVARMRDLYALGSAVSLYENFINLFSKDDSNLEISLDALCIDKRVTFKLTGEEKKIMMDPNDLNKRISPLKISRISSGIDLETIEIDAFDGNLAYTIGEEEGRTPINIDEYSTITGMEIRKDRFLNITYLSPVDHIRKNIFTRILNNDSYKEICLRVMQLLDPNIIDLLILRNEYNNRPVEYIKHKRLGNMPLSTYGDGIKKILLLANGIAASRNGILLIDEMETAIHSRYYEDIFSFIVKAAMQFKVQLLATTHNVETIDELLKTQEYEYQNIEDNINVITFKKDINAKKTYTRVLPGRRVYANRGQFEFEVRL